MQFRHLRYFVKIVEAGSFSRAAAAIHVAQPALSQQIAELEARMGVALLVRSARGVRPTAAGDILYREASAILRDLEQLPGIVRSSGGEAEGAVRVGFASMIAAIRAGAFVEKCKKLLPKVTLRFDDADSETIKSRIEKNALDMAVVFEDELIPIFSRKPLFRQRLYLIRGKIDTSQERVVSLDQLADFPFVMPTHPNDRRGVIERAFAAAGLTLNIAAEFGALSGELSAVRAGVGSTIINTGNLADISGHDLAEPALVEPPLYLTCSLISSGDFPLTRAGEAVWNLLIEFIEDHLHQAGVPGAEWIG